MHSFFFTPFLLNSHHRETEETSPGNLARMPIIIQCEAYELAMS